MREELEAEETRKGEGLLAQYLQPRAAGEEQEDASTAKASFDHINSKNKKLKKKLLEKDERVKQLEAQEGQRSQ